MWEYATIRHLVPTEPAADGAEQSCALVGIAEQSKDARTSAGKPQTIQHWQLPATAMG